MPPMPSPGQVVRLDWNYLSTDAAATNIFYFSYSGAGALSPAEMADFVGSTPINTDLAAPYVGASPGYTSATLCKCQDLVSDMGVTAEFGPGWTGTNTGSPMAASNSVVVSEEILRHYRGGHPRKYLMVGTASDIETGSNKYWQAEFLTNLTNGFNAFLADFPLSIGSRTYNPVSISFWETVGGVKTLRATPLVDLVTSFTVRDRICSQRRRLGKVGG